MNGVFFAAILIGVIIGIFSGSSYQKRKDSDPGRTHSGQDLNGNYHSK